MVIKKGKGKRQGVNHLKQMNEAIGLNNVETKNKPTLIISKECHSHILELHKEYIGKEWLAWCKTVNLGGGKFKLIDMLHPQQTASAGECEATDEGMEQMMKTLIERNEPMGQWNLVLHSHNQMNCFWSGTDNNARLGLNDGRKLAWAVVTNYQSGVVGYKGCVNFYKPYNIEIDCDIEVEEGNLSEQYEELYNSYKEYKETRQGLIEEKYNEKLNSNEEVKAFTCSYPLDDIYSYLGIDVKEELEQNKRKILEKMPCECKEFKELLKQLKEQATNEVDNEIGAFDFTGSEDVLAWGEWNDDLMAQMEKALVKPTYDYTKYHASTGQVNDWGEYNKVYSQANLLDDEEEYEVVGETMTEEENLQEQREYLWSECQFNCKNYPTRDDIITKLDLPPRTYVKLDDYDGLWYVRSKKEGAWEYLGDVIDYVYENEFDYSF